VRCRHAKRFEIRYNRGRIGVGGLMDDFLVFFASPWKRMIVEGIISGNTIRRCGIILAKWTGYEILSVENVQR
jgi:hypothetical protein